MDKTDKKLLEILNTLKLEVHKAEGITIKNLPALLIKAMRCLEKLDITGERKKATAVDLLLLLLVDHAKDGCRALTAKDLEEMAQWLFDSGILLKGKRHCVIV